MRASSAAALLLVLSTMCPAETARSSSADLIVFFEESGATGGVTPGRVVAADDIDSDGWADFALSTQGWIGPGGAESGRVWLISGRTGAVIRQLESTNAGVVESFGVVCAVGADATGDLLRDVLVASIAPALLGRIELRNAATGAVIWSRPFAPEERFLPATATLQPMGDWDADAVSDFEAHMQVGFLPNATRIRSGATGQSLALFEGPVVPAGDIDHDSHPDLLVLDGEGLRFVSGFTLNTLRYFDPPAAPSAAVVTPDLNADDEPEVFATSGDQSWILCGRTGAVLRHAHPRPDSHIASLAFAGDANADGFSDVWFSGAADGLPAVWLVSGRTGAPIRNIVHDAASDALVFNPAPSLVFGEADLNNDAIPDLLARGFKITQPPGRQGPAAFVFHGLTPCPADATYDRAVDFLDLNLLLSQFGQHAAAPNALDADINHDDDVNMLDLNLILSAYGAPCSK